MPRLVKNVVACIPTSNRPQLINNCVKSLLEGTVIPGKIVVLDSSSEQTFSEVQNIVSTLNESANGIIELQRSRESISPSSARYKLAQSTVSEFLLYLDDDMVVEPNSIKVLTEIMGQNTNIDILGCGVFEYGIWRDIGFKFDIGISSDHEKFVSKKAIRKEWMDLHSINLLRVDLVTQPPFLLRRAVFEKINFDTNYKWSYEIFDFFFACFLEGVESYVTTEAYVNHFPTKYSAKTLKDDKVLLNKEGKQYFESKWNLSPIKELRKSFIVDLFFQLIWRIRKKRMIKHKIKKDGVKYH